MLIYTISHSNTSGRIVCVVKDFIIDNTGKYGDNCNNGK